MSVELLPPRLSNTLKSTSLGTVLNAATTRAPGTLFASSSAPDELWATTRSVSSAFMGSEQVTMTFPARSPRLPQHVVEPRPVRVQQQGARLPRGLGWGVRRRVRARLAR